MTEKQLRKQIIEACEYLQKKGLIARTWGNVSARLNDEEFIITPSGLAYELTKPKDLVKVKIADCSYDKDQRKPSSEKGVHAAAYKARSDVNFIVHTHQFYASAICAEEESITMGKGEFVPCAKYGLPSTDRLKKNCEDVFNAFSTSNAFLMAKHGAITFGETMEDALKKAEKLEKACKKLFNERVEKFYVPDNMQAYLDDYAQMFPVQDGEDETAIKMVKEKNAAANLYVRKAAPLGLIDRNLQHLIYKFKYSKMRDK